MKKMFIKVREKHQGEEFGSSWRKLEIWKKKLRAIKDLDNTDQ